MYGILGYIPYKHLELYTRIIGGGDYFINHEIRISIKQPWRTFFSAYDNLQKNPGKEYQQLGELFERFMCSKLNLKTDRFSWPFNHKKGGYKPLDI